MISTQVIALIYWSDSDLLETSAYGLFMHVRHIGTTTVIYGEEVTVLPLMLRASGCRVMQKSLIVSPYSDLQRINPFLTHNFMATKLELDSESDTHGHWDVSSY